MIETGVIHGRFQVLHNDHLRYLLAGKARCRHLVVGITNPDPSLTAVDEADPERHEPQANPLTYFERYLMIRDALPEAGLSEQEFSIVPFPVNRPELYRFYVPLDGTFFLTIYDDWGQRKREMFESAGLTDRGALGEALGGEGASCRRHTGTNGPGRSVGGDGTSFRSQENAYMGHPHPAS